MRSRCRDLHASVVLAIGLLAPGVALAAEKEAPPPTIYQHWVDWVKPGHEAEFEEAVKAHMAWRKSAGEGFDWQVYTPVVGSDLRFYAFRAGPFHWKDLDAQAEWAAKSRVLENWNQTGAPHVERGEHYLYSLDAEHSLWYDSNDYRYFGVTSLRLKPGAYEPMMEALKVIQKVAKETSWKPGYSLQWVIGGADVDLEIVNPYRSYAEMADPETPFDKTMADSLGSDRAAQGFFQQFWGSFERGHYMIVVHRPDLSTQK